jgi:hypothetical protein
MARPFDIDVQKENYVQLNNTYMKRVLRSVGLLLCAGLISASVANAQEQSRARVGFKGGLNMSNLYVNDTHDNNQRVGWHGGVYAQLFASEAFSIQPEVAFSTKGTGVTWADGTSIGTKTRFNLSYIDIPVLAVFKLGRAAEIHLGPYWSYLLSAEIRNNDGDPSNEFDTVDRRNFDNWDYGLVGGIGFNFGRAAQLGVRYNYGLNPIANSAGARATFGNSKNQVAQLYLAFNLNADDDDVDDGY